MAADEPIISLADLGFTYARSDRAALSAIDLEIRRGEFLGVMGLNGAGKTTLGLCLNGIVPHMLQGHRTGSVLVEGRDPTTTAVREMARTVGIVFADPESQMSQPTVAEEVAMGLENLGVEPGEMPDRIAGALRVVGLDGLEERSPMALSGGEQQRLAIAAVLAMRPSILFMDEPTSGLDPVGKTEIFEIAGRLNRDDGVTVIVAEHEVELLADYADRIIVLHEGRMALVGSPSEVFGRVDVLASLGLHGPQVTEFASEFSGQTTDLPVTIDGALRWLEGRA